MKKDLSFYNQSTEEILHNLATNKGGLNNDEAKRRLGIYGLNVLKPKRQSWLKRFLEPFSSIFVSILIVAMIISLWSHEQIDAVVIGFVLVLNAAIYYIQQYSATRVLQTLKQQGLGRVHVKRGGAIIEILNSYLVPGDIVYLQEGLKVPADGYVIEADNLHVDEAILTGESLPVHKNSEALLGIHEVYEQTNMVFMDTLIHNGNGIMVVTATGNQTEIGAISTLISGADLGRSPIERKIDDFTKKLALVIGVVGALVFALALARGISTAEALRFSLALIVSVVPEGLPVALTVVLLLSAKKLTKVKALVKKISSIETLGAVTLIATDKTGTLTKNRLSVAEMIFSAQQEKDFGRAVMASLNGDEDLHTDALDSILDQRFREHIPKDWKKLKNYPFQQNLRMSGVLWETGGKNILYVKGAPEAVLSYSKNNNQYVKQLSAYVGKGYRAIAVAHKEIQGIPENLELSMLAGLEMDGLMGLADELRDDINESVAEARRAGIKVVMLTGDHVDTARNIALKIGLATHATQVSDSTALEAIDSSHLQLALKRTTAFGRVLPKHKFNFLRAIKGQEITAMTGDGVNDIPALVEADAGLSMGSGTDAAKEASDIVLLDDNFQTIIAAIKVGRTVIANIRKMLFYVISTSIGEAMTMVGALLLGFPLPVTAVQILWINLVTDGFTVLPLGLSASEQHQMEQPPNNPKSPLLSRWYINRMVATGLLMAVITLALFNRARVHGAAYATTVAFVALVVAQWANALNANFDHHSWIRNFVKPNKALLVGILLAIFFQIVAMYGPLSSAFHTVKLSASDLLLATAVPFISVLLLGDLYKFVINRPNRAPKLPNKA